jgi:hypothetical protein
MQFSPASFVVSSLVYSNTLLITLFIYTLRISSFR